jgi:hypothetical protein
VLEGEMMTRAESEENLQEKRSTMSEEVGMK